jgi:hypothetical protein
LLIRIQQAGATRQDQEVQGHLVEQGDLELQGEQKGQEIMRAVVEAKSKVVDKMFVDWKYCRSFFN